MGIIFNMNKSKITTVGLREFEADGISSEEEDDNYSADNEDVGTDSNAQPQSEEEPESDDGEDDDYSMDNEDTGEDNQDTEEGQTDTDDEDDSNEDDDYTIDEEDTGDENQGAGDDGSDTSEEDDDYSMDNDADDDSESGENDDTSSDDSGEDSTSKLKELEAELFENLSPEQKQIKIDELKKCFQELYNRCDNIVDIINKSDPPDENVSKIFEYINNNMSDLKQYIYDYFTYTFETKKYLENEAQYQKYIAVLNSYNKILDELVKKKDEDDKK